MNVSLSLWAIYTFLYYFSYFLTETSFYIKKFCKKTENGGQKLMHLYCYLKKNIKSFPCEQDTISMGTGGEDT
jgi:hypothetical protein